MPHFLILCDDQPNGFDMRTANRPEHVEYLNSQSAVLRLAGPVLDDEGRPIGSMLIVETDDIEGAKAFAAGDPFSKAGLFVKSSVRPWRATIGSV